MEQIAKTAIARMRSVLLVAKTDINTSKRQILAPSQNISLFLFFFETSSFFLRLTSRELESTPHSLECY